MWHLTGLALRGRIATIIIAILLAGASVWALLGLKMELIPNINFPYLTVVTVYPEATPDAVVNQVTSPIEKIIWDKWSGRELKHVTSTTSRGMSVIMAEFEYGTDMSAITNILRVDIDKLSLPSGVTDFPKMTGSTAKNPQIIPINLSMMPLVAVSLSGESSPEELKQLADTQIVPRLKVIPGVLRVDVEGGEKDQVIIAPNPEKMNQFGVSLAQIAGLIQPSYSSIEALKNSPLGESGVKLGDVAGVSQGPPPLSVITRTNGKPSIGISIVKEEKANTVEVANSIASSLKAVEGNLGGRVQITPIFDQSDFIEDSIGQLWEKAIVGGVLAIIVVFVFLLAVRASLITAISIPLSVLIGFFGMRMAGITINLLTLSAMSIAVGRLIDDSIVMVEVIFRRRQRGENFKDAAIGGAKEVANPITSATLATVAIFIPLMFVGGIVGELFIPFALTVTFAMMASLLVALMVVPALSRFLVSTKSTRVAVRDNWYQKLYLRALRWSLLHRVTVLVIAILLFVGSLGLVPVVGTSFMSGMSEKMITVGITLPPKTEVGLTSAAAARVEALLDGNEMVKSYYTSIGTSTSMAGIMSAAMGGGSNTASIEVYLDQKADLRKETDALIQATRGLIEGGTVAVSNSESGSSGMAFGASGINLSVRGKDQDEVARVTAQLMERLKNVKGLADLKSDLTTVIPKLNISVDQAKVMSSGLPMSQLAGLQQEFVLLLMGSILPGKTVESGGASYPVYIQGVTQDLTSLEQAGNLKIGYPQSVKLSQLANITYQELPSHISHADTFLSASITGSVTDKNVGAVNTAIQKEIDALPSHPGVAAADNEAVYSYPNTQEAAPLWFHDHLLGGTRLNATFAGLAGGYAIIDPGLTLPTGLLPVGLDINGSGDMDAANEVLVPLVIQDRMFDTNGELFFPNLGANAEHPYWVPEFVGDTIVVNGKAWPYLNVDQQRYRFYAINGSNSRPYDMFLQDQVSGVKYPMWVISTDGGYLDTPVLIDPNATGAQNKIGVQKSLMMMPGERYEIIIDFAGVPAGSNLILRNTAPTVLGNPKASLDGRIMQFRVSANVPAGGDNSYNPATLTQLRPASPIVRLPGAPGGPAIDPVAGSPTQNVDVTRQLTLNEVMGAFGPLEALVNNSKWSGMRPDGSEIPGSMMVDGPNQMAFSFMGSYLTELPQEGQTEIWEIINLTMDSHPIHLHGLQFQLIDRQAFDMKAYMMTYNMAFMNDIGAVDPMTGLPYPNGVFIPGYGPPLNYFTGNTRALGGNPDPVMLGLPLAPLSYEAGWKDTIITHPGEKTRIVVRIAPQDRLLTDTNLYWDYEPNALNGVYVWHCHITDHEDNEMMRPEMFLPNPDADGNRTYIQGVDY